MQQQRAFVCPNMPKDESAKAEVFAKAARGIKVPAKRKQAQYRVPRGGSRGRGNNGKW